MLESDHFIPPLGILQWLPILHRMKSSLQLSSGVPYAQAQTAPQLHLSLLLSTPDIQILFPQMCQVLSHLKLCALAALSFLGRSLLLFTRRTLHSGLSSYVTSTNNSSQTSPQLRRCTCQDRLCYATLTNDHQVSMAYSNSLSIKGQPDPKLLHSRTG